MQVINFILQTPIKVFVFQLIFTSINFEILLASRETQHATSLQVVLYLKY